jgi:putative ABC transport system permease protein
LSLLGGTIGLGIISGLYPSIYLSSFQPVKVLKGSAQTGRSKSVLRNILVVTQFASAIFPDHCHHVCFKTIKLYEKRATGFDREQGGEYTFKPGNRPEV